MFIYKEVVMERSDLTYELFNRIWGLGFQNKKLHEWLPPSTETTGGW